MQLKFEGIKLICTLTNREQNIYFQKAVRSLEPNSIIYIGITNTKGADLMTTWKIFLLLQVVVLTSTVMKNYPNSTNKTIDIHYTTTITIVKKIVKNKMAML